MWNKYNMKWKLYKKKKEINISEKDIFVKENKEIYIIKKVYKIGIITNKVEKHI